MEPVVFHMSTFHPIGINLYDFVVVCVLRFLGFGMTSYNGHNARFPKNYSQPYLLLILA